MHGAERITMDKLQEATQDLLKKDIPDFSPGDTVAVDVRVWKVERNGYNVSRAWSWVVREAGYKRHLPSGKFQVVWVSNVSFRYIHR